MDSYADNRQMGLFILIDRTTLSTAVAGVVGTLDQATNVHRQPEDVIPQVRTALKAQQALMLWLTGLPGEGNRPGNLGV
jgi:hypothetical protein